uniref:RNA-dependent RNA polymerase n=1 Tax=Hymenoscyphus fraxineus mitovirus 2 TaxID=2963334 RepID=A0A976RX75_9VIRU|nr:RNA-dependent RNA polymerase [Hymenoscyphus fraxineus mitovirus 2]
MKINNTSIFNMYKKTSDMTLNSMTDDTDTNTQDETNSFVNNLEIMTKYMTEDRFKTVNNKVMKSRNNMSPETNKFTGRTQENTKTEIMNTTDIMKFFKSTELFLLKRDVDLIMTKDKELGKYTNNCMNIMDNLPKTTMSIDNIDKEIKNKTLNYIFSVMSIYRHFKMKTMPNSETMSGKYEGHDLKIIERDYFSYNAMETWTNNLTSNWDSKDYDMRTSMYSGNASSPNSGSSSTKITDDVAGVIQDEKTTASIKNTSKHFKGSEQFLYLMNTLEENMRIDPDFMTGKIHSRLFHFTASGGKARMMANVDWTSQTALSAMHFTTFSMTRSLKQDFTFSHKSATKELIIRTEKDERYDSNYSYYSMDLSAATDRLPRYLQSTLLRNTMDFVKYDGKSMAENWTNTIDREYSTKNSLINESKPTRYEVGQGMGTFTSWPIMSLLHHYIVNSMCEIKDENYCLVGDDTAFFGTKKQYDKYIEFMTMIGVSVNPTKTVKSSNNLYPTIEFARNFIMEGTMMSPLNYGVTYAWYDKKVSFETLMWYFNDVLDMKTYKDTIFMLKGNMSMNDWTYLTYFWYKNNENTFNNYDMMSSIKEIPKWIDEVSFKRIREILSEDQMNMKNKVIIDTSFMSNFKSQCTTRKSSETLKTDSVINAMSMTSYIDEETKTMSDMMVKRFKNADFIRYDSDTTGGPTLTKKERHFTKEINQHHNVR